jgi:hypothetical protein
VEVQRAFHSGCRADKRAAPWRHGRPLPTATSVRASKRVRAKTGEILRKSTWEFAWDLLKVRRKPKP